MGKRIKIDVEVRYRVGLTVEVNEDVYNGLNLTEEFDDYTAALYNHNKLYDKAICFLNDNIHESDSYEQSYKVQVEDVVTTKYFDAL